MAGVAGRSGGYRPGAGRKPTNPGILALQRPQERRSPARKALGALPVIVAPASLPADQRAIWEELAPLAAMTRTLTRETVPAFRDLCEAVVLKRAMLAQLLVDGLTVMDTVTLKRTAHPLMGRYQMQVARVETKQARFLLEATGRPAAAPEPVDDPFEEFEQDTVQ